MRCGKELAQHDDVRRRVVKGLAWPGVVEADYKHDWWPQRVDIQPDKSNYTERERVYSGPPSGKQLEPTQGDVTYDWRAFSI